LSDKYGFADGWGWHPKYREQDWMAEIRDGNTRRGYREWVAAQIEEQDEPEITYDPTDNGNQAA
jgi:uncharacterized protein (UPF0248 family)